MECEELVDCLVLDLSLNLEFELACEIWELMEAIAMDLKVV